MSTIQELADAVEHGKRKIAVPLTQQAIDEGIDPEVILNEGLIGAMDVVGDKFSKNEIFVPEMLVAAKTMGMCTDVLKPYLAEAGNEPLGKGLIATVAGDMHDIGKNLVRLMLEGKGFEIEDMGVDVPAERVVEYIQANPDTKLICLSALLTTTLPALENTVKAIQDAGLQEGRLIFIGGAPVTQELCDKIGADYYTEDAGSCAAKAAEVIATV